MEGETTEAVSIRHNTQTCRGMADFTQGDVPLGCFLLGTALFRFDQLPADAKAVQLPTSLAAALAQGFCVDGWGARRVSLCGNVEHLKGAAEFARSDGASFEVPVEITIRYEWNKLRATEVA